MTGVLTAKTTVLAQVASAVLTLGVAGATVAESVEQGLRRTLSDGRIERMGDAQTPRAAVDWAALRAAALPVVLALNDSSRDDRLHVQRLSLTYWGGSVPVAWAVWEQHLPLPEGADWQQVEAVLAAAARVISPDLAVVVTTDRAFDIAPFGDRVAAHGWHWVVRAKARSDLRYRDHQGREHALPASGQRRCARRDGGGRGGGGVQAGRRASGERGGDGGRGPHHTA